jgi:hypothetical protein
MTSPIDARAALVDYLEDKATWRASLAERDPDDPRSDAARAALTQLAQSIADLPESDERFATLAGLDVVVPGSILAGGRADALASGYGFDAVAESPDQWFTHFVDLLVSAATDAAIRREIDVEFGYGID